MKPTVPAPRCPTGDTHIYRRVVVAHIIIYEIRSQAEKIKINIVYITKISGIKISSEMYIILFISIK